MQGNFGTGRGRVDGHRPACIRHHTGRSCPGAFCATARIPMPSRAVITGLPGAAWCTACGWTPRKAHWYRNRFVGGSQANTNVIGHGGRTLAIVESGGLPQELSYTLDSVGDQRRYRYRLHRTPEIRSGQRRPARHLLRLGQSARSRCATSWSMPRATSSKTWPSPCRA